MGFPRSAAGIATPSGSGGVVVWWPGRRGRQELPHLIAAGGEEGDGSGDGNGSGGYFILTSLSSRGAVVFAGTCGPSSSASEFWPEVRVSSHISGKSSLECSLDKNQRQREPEKKEGHVFPNFC
jgi:hypothetical protein